jgi:hypothetical protein
MAKTSQGVEYGSPHLGKGVPVRSGAGRMCSHEGCTTILSTYNSATSCWAHMPNTMRRNHVR